MNSINSNCVYIQVFTEGSPGGHSVCLSVQPRLTEREGSADVPTRALEIPAHACIHVTCDVHACTQSPTLYSWCCSEATISASLRHCEEGVSGETERGTMDWCTRVVLKECTYLSGLVSRA